MKNVNLSLPKVSIIVPVCNTERFVSRCIRSIIAQTYDNIEIICVNDGSTDRSGEILEKLKATDDRIKLISHEENLGLFKARLTGVRNAGGDYIAFVDSDDYINEDFIRCLVSRASLGGFDIVMGDTVHENTLGERWIHAGYNAIEVHDRFGSEVLAEYLAQQGHCFLWHAVWNKIYKKRLFDEGMPFLESVCEHLVMGEDILFSSVIHYYAKSFSKAEFAYYFYVQHSSASTSLDAGVSRFEKNLSDLASVFSSVESFFIDKSISEKNLADFYGWRALYARFWCDNIKSSGLSVIEKRRMLSRLPEVFCIDKISGTYAADNWFYAHSIPFDDRYLNLVSRVVEHDTISFDLFDTVFLRKCYNPTDAFYYLDKGMKQYFGRSASFHDIRILAERAERESRGGEITLDDIYARIGRDHRLSAEDVERVKRAELECEMDVLCVRKSIKNLIDLSHHLGKEVVITSDFYMGRELLSEILKAKGIRFDRLIVSADYGMTKASGELFSVLRSVASSDKILHIGDSWESDYKSALRAGIDAHFYPSCRACLMNEITDVRSTPAVNAYTGPCGQWISYEHALGYFEVRTALALSSIRLYDNPYISYLPRSAFNCSADFIGYLALGMHLWGVARWLYEENLSRRGKLHFIARDGYLPKLAYDIINEKGVGAPSNYLYASRKSLLPLLFVNATTSEELVSLVGSVSKQRLDKWLSPVIDKIAIDADVRDEMLQEDDICEYINKSLQNRLSKEKIKVYIEKLSKYFSSQISAQDAFFDIGYTGRPIMALSQLLGESFPGYFIHRTSDMYISEQRSLGIDIKCFYDYTPAITGSIREMLFSAQAASCVGYSTIGDTKPIFEEYDAGYAERFAIDEVQRHALSFVGDMNLLYKKAPELFSARHMDLSAPYEYFLSCKNLYDTDYFSAVRFEDEVYHGKAEMRLIELWRSSQEYHRVVSSAETYGEDASRTAAIDNLLSGRSKLVRAIFFLLFDRKLFVKKMRKNLFGDRSEKTL